MRLTLTLVVLTGLLGGIAQAEAQKVINVSNERATFAGGCFWGMEKAFGQIEGVVSTRVGYTGGIVPNPSYQQVCTGRTGHAEAIEVTFDPSRLSYGELLEFFFTHHDPTTQDRQGPDIGSQYRPAIFYHSPAQKVAALKSIAALDRSKVFKKPVVTQVEQAQEFYPAEDYHQKYLQKNPQGYCSVQLQSLKVRDILRKSGL